MSKRATTIYVAMESETGGECFDVLTHAGTPGVLERGVHVAVNFGDTGVAIVDEAGADGLMSQFNHAPGCRVTNHETH
ncbi:MAG: hypothetical protein ACRDHW_01150 [Ktedonobacteraceae bacterium]